MRATSPIVRVTIVNIVKQIEVHSSSLFHFPQNVHFTKESRKLSGHAIVGHYHAILSVTKLRLSWCLHSVFIVPASYFILIDYCIFLPLSAPLAHSALVGIFPAIVATLQC